MIIGFIGVVWFVLLSVRVKEKLHRWRPVKPPHPQLSTLGVHEVGDVADHDVGQVEAKRKRGCVNGKMVVGLDALDKTVTHLNIKGLVHNLSIFTMVPVRPLVSTCPYSHLIR